MYGKSALALALLSELLAARSIGNTFSRRGSLNPDLDCSKFDDETEYCVSGEANDDEPTKTTTTSTAAEATTAVTTSSSTKTTEAPSTTSSASNHEPTQPGLSENCDKFHKVSSGDQCDSIETEFKITHDQSIKWNPSINPGCTNLQLDYNVCVHVPGAVNTHGPTPQMPNLTSDCKKYHKVTDGESCPEVQKEAGGITLAQFRKWNPTVDAKCSNLWNGYYVCTGV
ncbi:uncharacterized protein N7498_006438 [Penicillium cinerascens]|uniref:LysM domain-containing protein n=1 Tax=Penicillium cinerascens TaxID=70096 RepID=A0A9W9MI86_9EURO|nr:uncharacterized protein N7498_006438 [Penicillium cinerascens]KAJ5201775.1 hypothetical protein N7498_006438 [Penicillium cinerascens]